MIQMTNGRLSAHVDYKPKKGCKRFDIRDVYWGHNLSVSNSVWENKTAYKKFKKVTRCVNKVHGVISPRPQEGDEIIFPMKMQPEGSNELVKVSFLGIITKVNRYGGDPSDWLDADVELLGLLQAFDDAKAVLEFSKESQIAPLRAQGLSDSEIAKELGLMR